MPEISAATLQVDIFPGVAATCGSAAPTGW